MHSTNSTLKIKVIPNSSRDQIVGWLDDALKVKLQAPPEDGKANKSLKSLLANALEITEKQITIEHGERSPEKLVRIQDLSLADVKCALEAKFKK